MSLPASLPPEIGEMQRYLPGYMTFLVSDWAIRFQDTQGGDRVATYPLKQWK